MNKHVRRTIVQVFSALNAIFMAFQPLAVLPVLLTNPTVVRAEAPVSFDAVDLTFSEKSHEFQLRVKTSEALPYVLTYFDEAQDPRVQQAAEGNLTQMSDSVFGADIYAGTCSSGDCTPISFIEGGLTVGDSFKSDFHLVDGQIVMGNSGVAVEQVCVNPDEVGLTAGETLWSVDETTGIAETKSVVSPGVTYQYPLNPAVSVTFNCLPADESLRTSLKIEQVQMSELNLPDTVTTDTEYAYDITTDMPDGSFTYAVSLPKAKDQDVSISYIEKSIDEAKQEVKTDEVKTVEESDSVKIDQQSEQEAVTVTGMDHFTIFVVVPTDLVSSNVTSYLYQGWRFTSTGNATVDLSDIATPGIPAGFGPDVVKMSRIGGPGNNRGYLGYFELGKQLGDIEAIRWNRFTKTGTDTYLNIFLRKGSQTATVVYNPSIVANIWEEEVFDSSTSTGIQIRVNNTTTNISFADLMANYGNWYIRNDSFCTASGWACLNVANLVSIGGIVLVSGSSSPTAPQEHYYDGVTIDFANSEPDYYNFVANHPEDLVAPTNLGWNLRSESATPAERAVDLTCGSTTNGDFPTYNNGMVAHNWETPDADSALKFQREWQVPGSGTWTTDPTVYGATNTAFATFGSATGTEGTWNTRVRSWLDQNGNNTLDDGTDVVSNWSNECTITYNREMAYCGDGIVNNNESCDYGSENGQSSCSDQCTWVNECRADMVTDGSFESPVVTNGAKWDIFGNAEVPGWTAAWVGGSTTYGGHDRPAPQIELHRGVLGAAAAGSEQYTELDSDWGGPDDNYSGEPASIALSQSIPTIPGNQYKVSWQYAARPNYANNDMTVSVAGSQVWDSGVMAGGGTIDWQTQSYTFTATTNSTTVTFTEVGPADSLGMFLDDVSVSCDGPGPVRLLAQKVVCDTEADLPNWGNHGATIGATTAADYVDAHPNSCHLENDWQFQWAPNGGTFGDFQTNTDPLGSPWTTFSANTPINILPSALTDGRIEVRELVANPDTMVPFSNDAGSVGSSVSSELYCTGDVYNYDNWEWVSNPQPNQTYYCVAFNALAAPKTNDVTVCKEDQSGNPLEGWTVGLSKATGFDQEVPVTNGSGVNASLVAGDYVVYSSGYYKYRTAEQIADAGFSYRSTDIPPYLDGWVSGDLLNTVGALELKINGSDYSWGGYNPNHQYFGIANGFAGGNLNLSIYDTGYGDNSNTGKFRASIGQIIATDQTGKDGCTTFTDVEYGDYGVFEAPQAGWAYQSTTVDNSVSQQFPATVTVADEVPSVVITNRQQGSIAGLKFEDNNMNGQQNNGDVGLADWHFNLHNANGNLLLDSAISDDQGNFSFDNLTDGTYQVCEVTQDGWVNSIPGGTGDEVCQTVQVESGQTSVANFGNFELGAIQGRKYQDDDQSGTHQNGEAWLSGWNIRLYQDTQNGWDQVDTTTTAGNQGAYRFENLTLGTYYACEVLQDGWKQTGPLLSGSDSVANLSPNASEEGPICRRGIINHSGQTRSSRQFGNIHQGQVTVSKFEDLNTNGVWDEDESLLADWEMNLATESGVLASQTTDDTGSTTFLLDPRTYNLSETEQKGWLQSGIYCDNQEVLVDRLQEQAQQIVESNSLSVTVNPGDQISCYVGNYQPGTIGGVKYFDTNQNGTFDEEETTLPEWQITLSGNDLNETVATDEDGSYQFENLTKGTYTVCEEDQTEDGWITEEPAEGLCHEVTIDQSGEIVTANFGNYNESELYLLKTNNAWPNDQQVGDEVTYTIKVMAVGGPVHDVTVSDIPPKQFSYIVGSYTADSSDGSDLKGDGTTPEPTYASPGTWQLGDLAKDEIITLTYKAKIGDQSDPGVYPDMVWATGTSEQSVVTEGPAGDLLALSDPNFTAETGGVNFDGSQGHFGDDNFAGTQVAVVVDQTPVSEYQVSRTEEKQGSVLGASTELPATGAHAWLTILALLSTVAGAAFLLFGKRLKRPGSLVGVMVLLLGSLLLAKTAQAATSVRIEAPYNTSSTYTNDASTGQTDMKVDFVALNTDDISITAQCQQQKDNGSWSNITTVFTPKAGGNSGYCEAKDLENGHFYDFRVMISGDGPAQYSTEVRVELDTDRPDKPTNYSKTTGNYCEDKISFKTANDGQTSSVEVYRSTDSDHFAARAETRVVIIPIGPNQEYTLTTSKPNCDDTYFYVIRAFDDNGNASDLVGDLEVTTVLIESSTGETQQVQVASAVPANSSFVGGSATGGSEESDQTAGESSESNTPAEGDETATDDGGSVLGAATETLTSFLSRFGLPIGVGLVVLAGLYVIFFYKRDEK